MRRSKEREQALRESVGRAWLAWTAEHGTAPRQDDLAATLAISRHAVGRALRYLESRGVPVASDSRRAMAVADQLPRDHPAAVALIAGSVEALKSAHSGAGDG
jgi:biotin operon repressor